ncbi:MAG: DNA repair protein RadA, partial [Hyphomonas sp.]
IGIFEMHALGLTPAKEPSALFLSTEAEAGGGTAVFAAMEGSRPVLAEVQALVAKSPFGTPRRSVIGFDSGRLAMLLAVLEARCGISLAGMDVYLSVAGGYRITEPAGDLAAAAALLSSLSGNPVPERSVFFGEVALSGAVRPAPRMDQRLKEAARLGFHKAFAPDSSAGADSGLTVSPIARLIALVDLLAPDGLDA